MFWTFNMLSFVRCHRSRSSDHGVGTWNTTFIIIIIIITSQVNKCNKRLFLLRQSDKLKVDSKILAYTTTPWYPVTCIIGSWYNSCGMTLLCQLARIEKQATKLIRKQDHQTLLMPASVYENSATASTKKMMADPQHPLHSYFRWLPSGIRLSSLYYRTNRHKDTAVPSFIRLLNENVTRSSQDEHELDPE